MSTAVDPAIPPASEGLPCYSVPLQRLIQEAHDDEQWKPVGQRIQSHPHEIALADPTTGMTALHDVCLRYPPLHIVQAMVDAYPTMAPNADGETPLHLAAYAASEEVQRCLLRAAPATAALADRYGDLPLHHAVRAGASGELLHAMVDAYPLAISTPNHRGVTPFWLLPRSFLEVETDSHHSHHVYSLSAVLHNSTAKEEEEEEEEEYYRHHDWDALVLFLQYAYYGQERAAVMREDTQYQHNKKSLADYAWMVHAAAATPACPRSVLAFLCSLFPAQLALQRNAQGLTPLQLAVRTCVVAEPQGRNDGCDDYDCTSKCCGCHGSIAASTNLGRHRKFCPHAQCHSAQSDNEVVPRPLSVVEILLSWNIRAAAVRDDDGRLPLTNALRSHHHRHTQSYWLSSLRPLTAAYPAAVPETDPVTGWSHPALAARYAHDLTTVFCVLQALPDSLPQCRRRSEEPVAKRRRLG